ncbi:hypothetical protein HDU79_001506 [Rhizoclosmatium sp. JEL0117]|nr:hypothetical protein HDU79_001506 [Rhizoclosmatium sp. JEL0117]
MTPFLLFFALLLTPSTLAQNEGSPDNWNAPFYRKLNEVCGWARTKPHAVQCEPGYVCKALPGTPATETVCSQRLRQKGRFCGADSVAPGVHGYGCNDGLVCTPGNPGTPAVCLPAPAAVGGTCELDGKFPISCVEGSVCYAAGKASICRKGPVELDAECGDSLDQFVCGGALKCVRVGTTASKQAVNRCKDSFAAKGEVCGGSAVAGFTAPFCLSSLECVTGICMDQDMILAKVLHN